MGEKMVQPQSVAKPSYHETKASAFKAEASKTNRGSVERCQKGTTPPTLAEMGIDRNLAVLFRNRNRAI